MSLLAHKRHSLNSGVNKAQKLEIVLNMAGPSEDEGVLYNEARKGKVYK